MTWSVHTRSPTGSPCSMTGRSSKSGRPLRSGVRRTRSSSSSSTGRPMDRSRIGSRRGHKMKRELKIGIFLAGTFVILAAFIFIAGDMSTWFRKPGYELSVVFPSATGLEKHAAARLAGVQIGYVKDIRLDQRKARVVLAIWPKYQVPKGSRATMASIGLVGERYVEISPSEQAGFLQPGETLEASTAVGFDQIGSLAGSIGCELKGGSRRIWEV